MLRYIAKRLLGLVVVLLGVTILSFVIANVSAVDPAEAYMRMNIAVATEENIETMRQEMGLDQPVPVQYVNWLGDVIKLDFGKSYVSKKDVIDELMSRLPSTLLLVTAAIVTAALVTSLLGILSALYRNSWLDKIIHALTLMGASTPQFWLGYILVLLFSVHLKLLHVTGYGNLKTVLLPAMTLAVPIIGMNVRILRANILENINDDYVLYAKARGLSKQKIIGKHVLKNAAAPMLTIFAQTFGHIVAGSIIVENVFSWPGVGNYAISAILNRDLPVINAYVLIMAVIFVVCNLIADILQIKINPKLLTENGDL